MIISEILHAICCLFMWCIAFAAFASAPIVLVYYDGVTAGLMWCVAFVAWAAGLAFYESHLRLRQIRIEDKIWRQYNG